MKQDDARDWIGRETMREDIASIAPQQRLRALLDRPFDAKDAIPPLGHWLYFLPDCPQARISSDGHPHRGDDLPDLGLPRRMWAGSRISFCHSLHYGRPIERRTRIVAIRRKQGRSGELAFVTLQHEITSEGVSCVLEDQDIVFREASSATNPGPGNEVPNVSSGDEAKSSRRIDPAMLFRFSALTYNAHRIHYDRDYARDAEGYPALVVHGPLQAVLLMDLFRTTHPDRIVTEFSFKALAPLFEGENAAFEIGDLAEETALRVVSPVAVTMTATVASVHCQATKRSLPDRTAGAPSSGLPPLD